MSLFEQVRWTIHPADVADWTEVSDAVGTLGKKACKAAYVCGFMRNHIEAAGCLLAGGYVHPKRRSDLKMFDGLTTQLLNGLAQQLGDFWKQPEVGSAEIMPLWYGSKPLFIEDMLSRDAQGMTVDRPLLHEESWRT